MVEVHSNPRTRTLEVVSVELGSPEPVPEPIITPTPTAPPVCWHVPAEVIFLVDGSGSVGQVHQTASFLKDVVEELPVGTDSTRVGIVQYSGLGTEGKGHLDYSIPINTNEIKLTDGTTQQKVNTALDNMKWNRYNLSDPMTYTGEAIYHALNNKHMFPSAREDSKLILVIITDGRSNSVNEEMDVKKMADEAREKKSKSWLLAS